GLRPDRRRPGARRGPGAAPDGGTLVSRGSWNARRVSPPHRRPSPGHAVLGLVIVAAFGPGCAHAPALVPSAHGLAWASPPAADDSTIALFRFDETTGLRFNDAGPHGLAGDFGEDTQPGFGRFLNART